jgi:hypothetical protein
MGQAGKEEQGVQGVQGGRTEGAKEGTKRDSKRNARQAPERALYVARRVLLRMLQSVAEQQHLRRTRSVFCSRAPVAKGQHPRFGIILRLPEVTWER